MRCFAVFLVALASVCTAQQRSDVPEIGTPAAIIFRGTVLAVVTEAPNAPGEVVTARITFRIDDGVCGVATGETFTIRQWKVAGAEYRVGEALVLFLHAPSEELGITSAVGGHSGHRRVDEVPAEFLNSLRCAPKPVTTQTAPTNAPLRPTRPTREESRR